MVILQGDVFWARFSPVPAGDINLCSFVPTEGLASGSGFLSLEFMFY
jgi:hypothetical protein